MSGTPNGIRTHVSALRGRRPRPLDNGGRWLGNKDLNLDNTSQSRRCCRYTIPQHAAFNRMGYYTEAPLFCQYFFSKSLPAFPVSLLSGRMAASFDPFSSVGR